MLNVLFCPIKQKFRRNECEVSMVKIPQHKVTKCHLIIKPFLMYLRNSMKDVCSGWLSSFFGSISISGATWNLINQSDRILFAVSDPFFRWFLIRNNNINFLYTESFKIVGHSKLRMVRKHNKFVAIFPTGSY